MTGTAGNLSRGVPSNPCTHGVDAGGRGSGGTGKRLENHSHQALRVTECRVTQRGGG